MINIGTHELSEIYVGDTAIEKAYVGDSLVWESNVPEFREVSYIENTSTAYIDTGVAFSSLSPSRYLSITIEVTATSNTWRTVFGSRWQNNDADSCLIQLNKGNAWSSRIYGSNCTLNIAALGRHTLKVENNMCYVDGTAFSNKSNLQRYSDATMTLLAVHNHRYNTITDMGLKCKIISCEIGNGNELVRDYIPVKQTSTGLYGLLDRINNVFYSSPNGILFAGPS